MVWEEGGINLAPLPDYMTQKNNMGWSMLEATNYSDFNSKSIFISFEIIKEIPNSSWHSSK